MYLYRILLPVLLLIAAPQASRDNIVRHYEAARAANGSGNTVKAESEYAQVLAEAYCQLGKIYSAEGRYGDAISAYQTSAGYRPDWEEALIGLGIAYFDAGKYNEALVPLGKVLTANPQSAGALQMTGKSYFMLGEFDRATAELEAARKLAPADYDVSYTLGLAFLKRHQYQPARQIYDGMLDQLGNRPELHIVFGRAYRETGFLGEALDEFKKAISLDPKFPRAHYYLGLTYLLRDGAPMIETAGEEFKLELISRPDEFFANYYLGILYAIQKKWDVAISFLEKAANIEPKNPDPYFHLGEAYQAVSKHDRAIEVLKKSIDLNPDLAHNDYQVTTAHYRLARSLLKVGQTEAGQKEMDIAQKLKAESLKRDEKKLDSYQGSAPQDERHARFQELAPAEGIIAESEKPDPKAASELKTNEDYYAKVAASVHQDIGLIRAGRQDYPAAAQQFGLAAKFNPQLERIYFNWGLAAYKSESYKEAIPPLEKHLSLDPSSVPVKQLLGMSYFSTGDYPKAAELLSAVIAVRPGEVTLYYPLALSLVKQGNSDAADRVIQKMVSIGENKPEVHVLVAKAYQEQGDPARALEELKTALALDGKTQLAHYYSGLIYIKMGKLEEACREFEAELALKPDEIEASYHLAYALLADQKTDRGVQLMKQVVRLKPDYAEAHYELGKALFIQGDVPAAIEQLEAAARLKPDEPYVHYQLGRAYLAVGRKQEGQSQLDAYRQLKDKVRSEPNQ
jgi:tetratricopeptide (TPR) repeat protein